MNSFNTFSALVSLFRVLSFCYMFNVQVTSSDGFGCVECGTISVTVTAAPGVDSECPSCPDPTSSIVGMTSSNSLDYL